MREVIYYDLSRAFGWMSAKFHFLSTYFQKKYEDRWMKGDL